MMKRIFFGLMMLMFLCSVAQEQQADSLFVLAGKAYKSGDYLQAENLYQKIINLGLQSPELYFNLGNTAYKQNRLTDAIYYYEKALKLNPSYEAAQENLVHVKRGFQIGTPNLPEAFHKRIWKKFVRNLRSNTWFGLSLFFLFSSLLALAVVLFARKLSWKRAGFYFIPFGLFFWLFFLLTGYSAYQNEKRDFAIVVNKETVLHDEPSLDGQTGSKVPVGEKVEVLKETEFWGKVKLPNGKTYWITKENYRKL